MHFDEYVAVFRRSWIILLSSAVIGVAVAGVCIAFAQPSFEAKTQVYVSVPASESTSISELQQGASYARQAVVSYAKLATSARILDKVIDEMSLKGPSESLASRVNAFAAVGTGVVNITVTETEPRAAAGIANSIANSLRDFIIEDANGPSRQTPGLVTAEVTQAATAPQEPVSPNKPLAIVLGLMFGLATGICAAFFRHSRSGQRTCSGVTSDPNHAGKVEMGSIQ